MHAESANGYQNLASYRGCIDRIGANWPAFGQRRRLRLRQGLFDTPVEKIAENIVEDLLTTVLDWPLDDVNLQIGRADMVLSGLGIKRILLELKRPGTLIWHRAALDKALAQARGYAEAQAVPSIAVSDGTLLYAEDLRPGGGRIPRVAVHLDQRRAPLSLWWISVHGSYRPAPPDAVDDVSLPESGPHDQDAVEAGTLVHPKYGLPARCFAYVAMTQVPHTWKLPYLKLDGSPDTKRLPKAIQAISSNYRGARVDIPREAVADVLVRLGRAVSALRKMPCQCASTADAYVGAHAALAQFGRLSDVGCCG